MRGDGEALAGGAGGMGGSGTGGSRMDAAAADASGAGGAAVRASGAGDAAGVDHAARDSAARRSFGIRTETGAAPQPDERRGGIDVVVIGGGVAGLVAARQLAHLGNAVT